MELERDFGTMAVGSAATAALELMEDELREAQYKEDIRAFDLMRQGKLTPDEAITAFARKFAFYQIHARLLAKTRAGTSAAKRIRQKEEQNG